MSFSIVYITHESREEADSLSQQMVEERLAACANVFPISAVYWWDGSVNQESEWVTLLKTTNEAWPKLRERVLQVHPYDVPCVMRWEVEANTAYENWISTEVSIS